MSELGVLRRYTFRLYPNATQTARLVECLRLHCTLYNSALQERRASYAFQKRYRVKAAVSYADQSRQLTEVRAESPEYAALSFAASQETLRRLEKAFQAFFRRVKAGETPGYPRFKSIRRYPGWGYSTHGNGWKMKGEGKRWTLYLKEVGSIRTKGRVQRALEPVSCVIQFKEGRWIERDGRLCVEGGKWYASVAFRVAPNRKAGSRSIGLDWGVSRFATTVDAKGVEQEIKNPRHLDRAEERLLAAQRKLSRKDAAAARLGTPRRGGVSLSNRRARAHAALKREHQRVVRAREDFLHKTSAYLVRRSALIVTEQLDILSMTARNGTGSAGLTRAILDTAPRTFFDMVRYKAEDAGVLFVEVPTREVRPSQTCCRCGKLNPMPLWCRIYECTCGNVRSRDGNSAQNMLNWALARLARGEIRPGAEGDSGPPVKRKAGERKPGRRKARR